MAKNHTKVVALILVNIALALAFTTGSVLMYEAVGHNDFNLDLYMVSCGIMMVSAFIAACTVPSLRNLVGNTQKAVRNIAEQTGKFLAFKSDQKKAGQET